MPVRAPDFTAIDHNGAPIKLSSLRGKTVLLNFWGFVNPPVADLNQDGVVNAADLTALLGNWGTVP